MSLIFDWKRTVIVVYTKKKIILKILPLILTADTVPVK